MNTLAIWKFEIPVRPHSKDPWVKFDLKMPSEWHFLSIQVQNGAPFFWALVHPKDELWTQKFLIRATGESFEGDLRYEETSPVRDYLGTFQYQECVWHLFTE